MKRHFWNVLFVAALAFVLIRQAPLYWRMWQRSGESAPAVDVQSLGGEPLQLPTGKNSVVVFWATWCPPCKVELERLNKLVEFGSVKPDQILAVSVGEDFDTVQKFTTERAYKFQVAIDPEGRAGTAYNVPGTPTVLLLNADGSIGWMTMGISPTLEFRVKSHVSK
jgi:thiol-disulfide isomerase/thioredoxin